MFSSPTRSRSKTTTNYGGSAEGQAAGEWGLEQYQGMMDPTAYTGNVPGAQGPNASQIQQYNMLTGMQETVPGAVSDAVGTMTPQQIAAMNRSGGPGKGYMNPYQDQLISGLEDDLRRANIMGNFALQTRKTSKTHDFFMKKYGFVVCFHGFPCQNFIKDRGCILVRALKTALKTT
mgnify:CR=1 FL=1